MQHLNTNVNSVKGQSMGLRHPLTKQSVPHKPMKYTSFPNRPSTVQTVNPSSRVMAVKEKPQQTILPSQGTPDWYACVANADFFFNDVQNEALAEQLRERNRFYQEQGRELDFFFACEPAWLDEKFPAEAKKVRRPAVALVSTDKEWITFMKLRLDRVLKLELGAMDIDTATKSTKAVPEFKTSPKWTAPYAPYAKGWWEVFMR